jgi:hypothetical protein
LPLRRVERFLEFSDREHPGTYSVQTCKGRKARILFFDWRGFLRPIGSLPLNVDS